MYMHRFCRENF